MSPHQADPKATLSPRINRLLQEALSIAEERDSVPEEKRTHEQELESVKRLDTLMELIINCRQAAEGPIVYIDHPERQYLENTTVDGAVQTALEDEYPTPEDFPDYVEIANYRKMLPSTHDNTYPSIHSPLENLLEQLDEGTPKPGGHHLHQAHRPNDHRRKALHSSHPRRILPLLVRGHPHLPSQRTPVAPQELPERPRLATHPVLPEVHLRPLLPGSEEPRRCAPVPPATDGAAPSAGARQPETPSTGPEPDAAREPAASASQTNKNSKSASTPTTSTPSRRAGPTRTPAPSTPNNHTQTTSTDNSMKRTLTLTIIILTLGTTLMACNRATTAPDSTPWDGIARGLQVIDHAPDQPGVKTRTITLTWLPNKPSETYKHSRQRPRLPRRNLRTPEDQRHHPLPNRVKRRQTLRVRRLRRHRLARRPQQLHFPHRRQPAPAH